MNIDSNIDSRDSVSRCRQQGFSLVEVVTAMFVFVVVAISVGSTLVHGVRAQATFNNRYLAMSEVRGLMADVQEIANLAQDLPAKEGVGAIYDRFNGATIPVNGGQVLVTCYANEATIPTVLGGPQDLNFDGDNADDLGNQSNGSDLKLIPMQFSVTFDAGGYTDTFEIYRLVAKTEDGNDFLGLVGGAGAMDVLATD